MSVKYTQTRIAIDKFEGGNFAPAGQKGDWLDIFISFEGDLPVKIPNFVNAPRVVVTPVMTTKFNGNEFNVMTPVCVARDVTTKGFRLAARNADRDFGGSYAFNWVAIEESAGVENPVPALEMNVFPSRHFAPLGESFGGNRTFGDHVFYGRDASLPDPRISSVQLTASDRNVSGHSVPAVGIVSRPFEDNDLDLAAHNTDIVAGDCAFNCVAFSFSELFDPAAVTPEPAIETGEVAVAFFQPTGRPGDWNTWDIDFKNPFAQPPVVLLTPNKPAAIPAESNPAVLGVVQNVTRQSFRLAARNSDFGSGRTGFYWIAISAPII
jgi:hypothetical protein